MSIYDRYLSFLFFRVLFVLFSAMCGLFVIVDFFDRLEELIEIAKVEGNLWSISFEFYTPRILSFFDRVSGLVTLIAVVFVITWIQRNHELVAIFAGGIHLKRVLRPLFICVLFVAVFGVVNRELLIPHFKDRLTRDTRNWFGKEDIPIRPTYDRMTGVFINGKSAVLSKRKIASPIIQLPPGLDAGFDRLIAESAIYHDSDNDHPAGYLFGAVATPDNIDSLADVSSQDGILLYMPGNHSWLEPGECFLVSRVSIKDLTRKDANSVYSSTAELLKEFQNPSRGYNSTSRVLVHARFLQPILDISLLFIGLPLVVSIRNQNIFLAIGLNLLVVILFFLSQLCFHTLGTEGFVSPALAAWLPIFVFVPLAYVGLRKLG